MSATTANPPLTVDIEDRMAIHDLVSAYSFLCDTKELGAISDLFAEAGVWDERVLGMPLCKGRQAVHDLFTAMIGAVPYVFHNITNERLTAYDGESANGTCHLQALGEVNGHPLNFLGYYDDDYVKIEGRWYFARRTLVAIGPTNKVM